MTIKDIKKIAKWCEENSWDDGMIDHRRYPPLRIGYKAVAIHELLEFLNTLT